MASIIYDSIKEWKRTVTTKENKRLVDLFENGNAFRYLVPSYAEKSSQLHVYPGIYKEKVHFFVIPAEYDTVAHKDDYEQYTKTCALEYNMNGNQIPAEAAKQRIKNWGLHHETWIPKQNATQDGLFLAFVIDRRDFETKKDTYVNLALAPNGEEKTLYTADLIVTNIEDSKYLYDDFSRPVPPYNASAAASDFYLLKLTE